MFEAVSRHSSFSLSLLDVTHFLHLKCSPVCFRLRCLFDLDGRNRAAGCVRKTG